MNKSIKRILLKIAPRIGKKLLSKYSSSFSKDCEFQEKVSALKAKFDHANEKMEPNEIMLRDGLKLQTHPESKRGFEHFCYISPVMFEELDCFIKHTKDKVSLLDVGALHGIFSLVFATNSPQKKVVAVDASPIAFSRLLYNVHKNNFSNIIPIECALSADPGILRMHYEWEHAVAANTNTDDPKQKFLSVARRTGDELCQSLSFIPDVIKIDVEGHEIKVVQGLSKIIESNRPMIFLELHPNRIIQEGDNMNDFVQFFAKNGYQASLVNGSAVSLGDIHKFTEDQRLLLVST